MAFPGVLQPVNIVANSCQKDSVASSNGSEIVFKLTLKTESEYLLTLKTDQLTFRHNNTTTEHPILADIKMCSAIS
jgi:hypothetical protein